MSFQTEKLSRHMATAGQRRLMHRVIVAGMVPV